MKANLAKPDRSKIDLSDDAVARQWSKKLGKTRAEIAVAIAKVGDNAETVRKELGCQPEHIPASPPEQPLTAEAINEPANLAP